MLRINFISSLFVSTIIIFAHFSHAQNQNIFGETSRITTLSNLNNIENNCEEAEELLSVDVSLFSNDVSVTTDLSKGKSFLNNYHSNLNVESKNVRFNRFLVVFNGLSNRNNQSEIDYDYEVCDGKILVVSGELNSNQSQSLVNLNVRFGVENIGESVAV